MATNFEKPRTALSKQSVHRLPRRTPLGITAKLHPSWSPANAREYSEVSRECLPRKRQVLLRPHRGQLEQVIPPFNSSSIPAPLRVCVCLCVSVYQASTVRVAQELATYSF